MRQLPTITKNILLINLLVYLFDILLQRYGLSVTNLLGLSNPTAGGFHIWQPLTYMFLHANFSHLFFNMFAVWMFGPAIEQSWGEKKFLIYYLVCGVGAALVQMAVWALFMPMHPAITIGASGAVFGILLAFGWLFPDVPMFILFIPVPIRARVFVIIYALIELFMGLPTLVSAGRFSIDNVAHFAHLGGMLFGALLILWWRYGQDKWHGLKRKPKHEKKPRFKDYHYQEPIQ